MLVPWSNAFWPGLTPFGPHMWQAGAETELTLTVSPTTAVGQKALLHGKLSMAVFPSETRSFEEKQIFQEEQKTICAIKLIIGFFYQFSPSFIII